MQSTPDSSESVAPPEFLHRAKNGSLTEALANAFNSFPSVFRRRQSLPEPTSWTYPDPDDALLKGVSKITIKDIQAATKCGTGGFGTVLLVKHPTQGDVALKQLRVSGMQGGADLRRRTFRQGHTWRRLKHPNVLRFLGILETATDLYLVSPYAKNGSLRNYIALHPEVDRQPFLWEAAAAIAFLHKCGLVHGNIKASNILVSDDVHSLLCDFGLAKSAIATTSSGLQGVGNIRFESPELLGKGGSKTFASDVWAFGMTIYEVLSSNEPFYQYTTSSAVITAIIVKDERPPKLPARSQNGVPYGPIWKVAEMSWERKAWRRPSMKAISQQLQPPPTPKIYWICILRSEIPQST